MARTPHTVTVTVDVNARPQSAWRWLLHNLVGHPAMALLHLCGMRRSGNWIHDVTAPAEATIIHATEKTP